MVNAHRNSEFESFHGDPQQTPPQTSAPYDLRDLSGVDIMLKSHGLGSIEAYPTLIEDEDIG
jgi:hypothetical protein